MSQKIRLTYGLRKFSTEKNLGDAPYKLLLIVMKTPQKLVV